MVVDFTNKLFTEADEEEEEEEDEEDDEEEEDDQSEDEDEDEATLAEMEKRAQGKVRCFKFAEVILAVILLVLVAQKCQTYKFKNVTLDSLLYHI